MEEIENLDQQALRPFCKSFTKRYEQWKRGNLLAVALETMPKQVDKAKVLDDLLKLHSDFAEDVNEEIGAPALEPSVETISHKLGETTFEISMEKKQKQRFLTSLEMFLHKLFEGDAHSADFIEPQQPGSSQESLPFSVQDNNPHFLSFQI